MGNSGSGTHANGFPHSTSADDIFAGERKIATAAVMRHTSAGVEAITELCQMLINKSRNHDVGANISRQTFLKYFNSENVRDFGPLLYAHACVLGNVAEDSPFVSSITFVAFCKEICNLITDTQQLKFYPSLFARNKANIDRRGVEDLFRTCFLLEAEIVGSKYYCDPEGPLLGAVTEAVSKAAVCGEKYVSTESLQTWLRKNFPKMLHSSVHRWLVSKVGTIQSFPPGKPSSMNGNGTKPKTKLGSGGGSSCSLNHHRSEGDDQLLHPVLVWFFGNVLPALYTKPKQVQLRSPVRPMGQCLFDYHDVLNSIMKFGSNLEWELLYSNVSHGQSINRFQHHTFSYRGPTAMLIKTDGDVLICVAIDQEWRERVSRWGGDNCVAMQITPYFKIFEAGEKLMYFNVTTRGYPFGLQVGKNSKSLVVEIDPDLCLAKVKTIPYKLEMLEVWGCADMEIKAKQEEQKKWEKEQAENHKKINRNADNWNENPDRYILELAGRPTYGSNFKR